MKYVLIVICCAGMVFATDYDPLTDWVDAPGTPVAWSYGARIETGWATGVFGDLIPGVHSFTPPFTDQYLVVGTFNTCVVGKTDPWLGKPGPIMNAWVVHQATARLTPEAGVYDITGNFSGTGYRTPSIQITNVYIVKNGTDILWQGLVTDYVTLASFALTDVAFLEGDYVDFISGNGDPVGESRTSLMVDVILQQVLVAWGPSPEHGATDVDTTTNLCWYSPSDDPNNSGFSYNVYYGYANDIGNLSGPFLVSGIGGQPHCYTPAVALDPDTEYAWRVDVLDPNTPGVPRTGNVWTFTTLPAYTQAQLVSPSPSGVTDVSYTALLDWNSGLNAEWANVYFDINESLVTIRDVSVRVSFKTTDTSYQPALMDPSTPYYWVVDEGAGDVVVASGTVWSFTTKAAECTAPVSDWDVNGDCVIDMAELAGLAGLWLECGYDHPVACP